jgi:transposase InsO family protein
MRTKSALYPPGASQRPHEGEPENRLAGNAVVPGPVLGLLPERTPLEQKTAIQFVDYVLERLPFQVQVIQIDNGSEFGSSFHYHVLDRGVGHRYIKPRTPRLNGKVERSHRVDAEEFYRLLDGTLIDDADVFNHKLEEWEDYYNFHRPHGGLAGQTPTNG